MTFLSWLGTLKSRNEDITSDALRIGQLEAAQALAQRAYEFRTSYKGQDYAKRRAAALKGLRK